MDVGRRPLSPGDAPVAVVVAAASVAIAAPEPPPRVWPVQKPVAAAACRTVLGGIVVAEPVTEPDVTAIAAAAAAALVVAG